MQATDDTKERAHKWRNRAAWRAALTAGGGHASALFGPMAGALYVNSSVTWVCPAFTVPFTDWTIDSLWVSCGIYYALSVVLFFLVYSWVKNPRHELHSSAIFAMATTATFCLVPAICVDKDLARGGMLLMLFVASGMCYGSLAVNLYDWKPWPHKANPLARYDYYRGEARHWEGVTLYTLLGTLTVLMIGLQVSGAIGGHSARAFPVGLSGGSDAFLALVQHGHLRSTKELLAEAAPVAARLWTAVIATLSFAGMLAGAAERARDARKMAAEWSVKCDRPRLRSRVRRWNAT